MKFLRYLQKKRRAMFAMAALTFFAAPLAAQASTITTKDGKTLTAKNKVYNIEVQKKLSEQVGVNKFKDFTLDKGHIANMQFDKLQTLANLVDNKISINGTVNALRDGKIGGNLYFLSPEGIAVGKTGVINAGAFTGMAVDKDYFNRLSKIDKASELMTELAPSKIAYNNDPSKGIDIQGVINAPGGISLYGTKIDVGSKAVLRTNVEDIDFSKVVNIMSGDEIKVDSGITGGLDASYSEGDIILKAHAEHIADDNMLTNIEKFIDSSTGTATRWEKDTTREATINVDGNIESAGGVTISADSKISFTEGSKWNVVTQSKFLESILGNLGVDVWADGVKKSNKATVNINKTANVHSAGIMNIGASAELSITLSAQTPQLKTGTTKVTQFIPAVAVAVIKADNKAEVNINGKLESDTAMAINAYAETELSNTAKASTMLEQENLQKIINGGKSDVPEDHNFIAVGVIDGETKADVNIKKGTKITVNGEDFTYETYAEDDKDKKNPIQNHVDALTIKATTINTVGNEVSADPSLTNIETASSTAVGVTNYNGEANINIEDETTTETDSATTKSDKNNVEINATNGNAVIGASNTFINTSDTSTGIGADPDMLKIFAEIPSTEFLETLSVNAAKKMFSGLQLAAEDIPGGAGDSTFSKIFKGELLKLGSAVSVFNQDNKANVNVGKNASINAMKDVSISSDNKIAAQKLSTTATINDLVPDAQKNEAMIGVGVQVSNVKNTADTVIKGSVNSSAGSVNINSYAGMNYNQVEALQTQFKTFFTNFGKQFKDGASAVKRTFTKYESQITKELDALSKAQDPEAYMTAMKTLNEKIADTKSTGFAAAVEALDKGNEIKDSFAGMIPVLTSFLHPANYTNYYVRSAFSENKTSDEIGASKLSAAGSFAINSMPNNSRIILAEDSAVTADKGSVDIKSNAENRIVAITGMGGEYGTSSEAANRGAGISVNVSNFKDNSVVAVGKNSQIKAANINIETKEYAKHFNLIYGNGKADSTSITGMVSYFNAPANNIISIDDSTKLDATNAATGFNNAVGLDANSERYITTVTGGLTLGNGNGKSFGATINVLNNNVNNAILLADNGKGTRSSINGTTLENKADAKILTLTNKTLDILGDYGELLGTSSIDGTGEINASVFNSYAKKTGTINSIAVAGTENSETHGFIDGFNNYVKKGSDYLQGGEMVLGMLPSLLSKYVGSKVNDKLNHSEQNNPDDAADEAEEQAGNENGGPNLNLGNAAPQLNIAGAGSVAVNLNSGETGAFVTNYKINTDTSNVRANDDTFHGSWAGAGAFNFFGDSQAAENTNVAVGGSVALTNSTSNVDSVVKNSVINSHYLDNEVNRADSDVSAGMGLAVSTGDEGTNVNIPISASINLLEGDTHSLLLNNNFTGVNRENSTGGSVRSDATIDSVQVAGGLALGVSKSEEKGYNIGGTAAVSQITNDLQSGIKGGSYENVQNANITATKKSNQVDVAVAGGVTSSKYSGGFAFGGAVAVSDIKNTANAFLKDTSKFNANGTINIDALEAKNGSSRNSYLATRKINTDATEYLANDDKNKIDTINGGGNIVNVAVGTGVSVSNTEVNGNSSAAGIGVSYAGITNLMNVDISNNQNITAKEFNANSTNKSNMVNVAVGVAGAKGNFSIAGSVGISDIKNDGTINIENSNVTADSFLSGANSSAHIVNVAGRANISGELATGLTFAYNGMNNTTGINIKNGTWNVGDFGLNSANNNYALAVGAGVAFSKEGSAINGAVGLNMGTNSTKSIADGLTLNGIKNAKLTATDNTSKTTVAGGVTISKEGTVALGGSVAYANIGKADNKEIINAKITNSNITTQNDSSIDVEALDKGKMTTVSVGVGAAVGDGAAVTFQGAAAVSEVNKDNIAEISNTNITEGTPDIKIIATSGGNSSDGLTISDKNIDVNNKINTAAAVLDFNLDDDSVFDGALAISVNNYNQSTQSNFKNTSRPEILSRAGNVDMFSNSEADILGVAIGGAGGKSIVSAAGSIALNYINNSAKTLVENENVAATKNFGVVAQSDDKIANYAGAVDVNADGYGAIGVSVADNEIKGDTDALIKNSKLEVGGSSAKKDLIAISNPKDNLIDGYVTRNNWTSGRLMSGRSTENKSGLVVNSSATHSISSDLATIGIRASSDSPGVGVSGTVNINKIDGATNAKVENTDLTAKNADSLVNASDYTNNGSFIGNAAVSGTIAVGVLWNENQVKRETNALVDGDASAKPTLNVKNLDVKADSAQGLSNLNIAVGAGFVADKDQIFAAASGDNIVRNQLEGKTTAKLQNAIVNHSGNVDVNAYHKDIAYATNIAAGVAVDHGGNAGATFDMGYGLMRENSTVEAEINNSTLKSERGSVNVNAENNSKLAGAFGTAGVAVHVGDPKSPSATASVALGINNNYITNTVHSGIKNSTLDVGAVDVNSKNTSELKADGGVAAVSLNISYFFLASLGAAVSVTNGTFDNDVKAVVDNSMIKAAGDVNINARDDHKSDETVVSAALSTGLAVSVNRMSTSINSGLGDLKSEQLGKALSKGDLVMKTDNASKENANSDSDKLTGEYGSENRFLNEENVDSLLGGVRANSKETKANIDATLKKRYTATVNYNNSLKKGVFANVANGSTIDAGDKISIGSTENNDLSITSGSGTGGPVGIGVGSTSIKARRANTANVIGSELNAKNIEITTTNGQTGSDGINSKMYNATLTAIGASVGYNNVETNGTGEILISNSKITAADNLNAKAADNSKSRSYILDAGLKGVGYTGVFAYNTNTAQTGIEIGNKSALNAKNINFNSKNQSYRATDTLAISAAGLSVQSNTSEANDFSNNFIKVNDAGNSFTADTLNFGTLNGSQTYSHTNGQAYLGLNAIIAKGIANTNSTSQILIDDENTFATKTANITAQIGEDGKYSAEATGFAINGSAVGVNIDDMIAKTKSTAQVNIGNEIYGDETTLNVSALNKASRNSFMRNNAYSLVANANDISAYTKAEDNSIITVGKNSTLANANKLAALNITSDTENKSYVAAKGTGGSIGGDFGSAAHADNDVNNTSKATLNGNWNIANDLNLSANQHDETYISGYSARGAILTGGKGSLDNVIKGSSTAKISDDAQIKAKTVNINSKNFITTDKYSDEYDYTLFGRMGGVVDDVDYQRSSATTNKSANINIGKNAAITTTGTQNYDAVNDYDLKNNVYAEGGSLLASLRWVKSHNYITTNEKIDVGTGATLKNEGGTYDDGGITFAAHDNLELNPTAKGFSQAGLGGYVRAENLTDLTRNQNVTINGTVKSAKDLNLYAGADLDGEGSKVHSFAQAISQVQTLISDGSADVIRKGKTNSTVNVNGDAKAQAAHDINIISNAGNETFEEFSFYGSTWSSTTDYKVATADKGNVTTADYKHSGKVKVDGELKAAMTPEATINISGVALPDGFILADNSNKNLSYSVKTGDYTITKKSTDFAGKSSEEIFAQQIYNGISTKTTDYPNDYLLTRYNEVEKLLGEYQGDVAAYSGLQQEKTALEEEMIKLGMGTRSTSTGDFVKGATPSIKIKALVLPDIEVSGGSININTDNFTGSGSLIADGVPKIDVNNKSTAYLITNRLTIADKGGAINFNGQSITNNVEINDVNGSKSGATFNRLRVAASNEVPTITVSNNYAGQSSIAMKPNPNAKGYDTLPDDAKTASYRYTPINYIEVTKDISNPVGKVEIDNKQGSIRILSGANVNAQDISMTAKESISQGYTDGIVNIGTTPEDAYSDEAKKLREETGWDKVMPTTDQNKESVSNELYNDGTGRIAGDAIYIAARDININGLIQAGYNGYKVRITQADIDNATETTYFNGELMYKVNDGGTKLDEKTGYYIYVPQVYYDKANNQIYVEDINSTGGKVYLAGRILSTGNGKIVVSDGASNIDIRNNSSVDMNVGKVTNTGGGFIQIVDTAQDKLSEYSSGQTRTIENYSAWLADNSKGKVTTGAGLAIGDFTTYNPQENLTYRWAEGVTQSTKYHYHKEEIRGKWGNNDDPNYTGNYEDMTNTYNEVGKPEVLDGTALGEGIFIADGNQSDNLKMYAQNKVGYTRYGIDRSAADYTTSGFFGYYHHHQHYWNKTVGTTRTFIYSLKADYPISVGIIGEKNPTINLTNASTTGGDLYLSDDIRNDVGAKLNITARGGKIEQAEGTKISTDNITLTARTGIKNIDVVNHRTDDLKLNAQSTTGNIDINVSGGIRDNQKLAGNVTVNALNSPYGEVKLTAQGDIKQTIKGAAVTAQNIKLDSANGAINLQIASDNQAGAELSAISAAAKGDIKLTKTDDADFLIGSIVSTTGDVELKAKGKFVDALDKVRDNADTDESDLIKSWIDMGLIAGTNDYKGAYVTKLEQDRDNYKADVTEQFTEYKDLLATYQTAAANYKALKAELDNSEPKESERLQTLAKKFGDYSTVDAYLAADKNYQTAQDKDAYKADATAQFDEYTILKTAYDGAVTSYNELKQRTEDAKPTQNDRLELLTKKFGNYETADAYLAADSDYQTLVSTAANPQYKWTADELLSGIRSAIVNKEEGTASDVTKLKDANITARNVTLTGAGVGSNSKETTTIKMSDLRIKANETDKEKSARLEKLSQLASVEAADVKVNLALDANGKPIVQTVTQVNYNYDNESGYYIDKAGNYVRYRKDANGNLLKYTYDKDLNQVGDAVAVNDFSDVIKDTTTIENKEIESFEISGTIPLGINATGNITVKTTGDGGIYIAGRNKGVKIDETNNPNADAYSPLNINRVETSKTDGNFADVRLIGEAGIFNAATSGANVIGKDLVLVGGNGAIGTEARPFAVQLTGDLLNARANDEINLSKVGTDNFRISAIYSPKAIRIANNGSGIIEHSSRFDDIAAAYINTPGEITLTGSAGTANNPILIRPHETTALNLRGGDFYVKGLNSGTVNLNDLSGNVDISSEGSIKQTADGVNNLTALTVAASGDVILDGNNKLDAINIGAIGGNFELKNDSDNLTANFGGTITGDAQINQRGNITSTGGLTATKEIKLSSATFTHEGEIHTDKLTIATDNGIKLDNSGNAFNSLEISSRDGNAINGSIEVAIKADNFAPTIKNDVTGDVTLTNTKKSGSLSFGNGETINVSGTFTANTKGNFDYDSILTVGKDISIDAQNIYRRADSTGYFSATGKILLNAENNIGTAENPIWFANTANKSAGLDAYGKNIYVKGVNSGVLTLGDVVGEFMNASSEGSIAQGDGKKLNLTNKLEVSATNDITLDNADNLIKAASILDGKNINLHSANADGLTLDGLKAKGDAIITSDNALALNGNIESDKDIYLTAGKDLTSDKASVLKANKLITLKADDVKLSGKVETAYKEMTSDKVEDVEKFIAEMPTVIVTTNKGLDMRNAANNFEGLYVNSDGEQIEGSVLVTGNSKGFLAVIDKKVVNDITLKNTKSDGIIILLDRGILNSTKGNITLEMGGSFLAGAALWANKNINITSRNDSITIAPLNVLIENNETSTEISDTLKAVRNINLKAAKTIEVGGQVTAGRNITADSLGIGVLNKGSIKAGSDIDLTVGEGDIKVEGSATANKGNVKMTIDKGTLDIAGKLRANKGKIDIELGEGDIQIGKDTPDAETVTAKGDINMTTSNGTITISGKTKSTSGSINIKASEKNQNSSANKNNKVLKNILNNANPSETNSAKVALLADETDESELGNITIDAEIEADDSIWIATDEGNIEITKQIIVNDGDITIATLDGDIKIDNNGSENMLSAQNNLDIETDNGAVTISGKIATQDGDISITSNHDTYKAGQKGITVEETGAINPGRNLYLNATNGDIEFKKATAENAEIKTINGSVTADTLKADDTIHIELEHGDLYLSLAQSKGVAILTSDSKKSSVNTIKSDSVTVDRNLVTVGQILPYKSTPKPSKGTSTTRSTASSYGFSNNYSNSFASSNLASNRSSAATLGSSSATLGTTLTRNGSGLTTTYWQEATSTAQADYSFSEFDSTANDLSYRLTRNYFKVRFVPTWLEREFMVIDLDYSFDNFGIKNATEDELTIS